MPNNPACIFCNSLDIKDREIIRNDLAWVFPTNIPIVPGHVLVCPVRCVSRFSDLTIEEVLAIKDLSQKVTEAMQKAFDAVGFNYAWNEGQVAGQSIPHFHLHVLPRKEGDTGVTDYEPRKFLYRPGSRETSLEQELLSVSKELKKFL